MKSIRFLVVFAFVFASVFGPHCSIAASLLPVTYPSASRELYLPVGKLKYVGPVNGGGTEASFTGTIQEIYDQMLLVNPEYMKTLKNNTLTNNTFTDSLSLEARVRAPKPTCVYKPGQDCHKFNEGIEYLRNLVGTCGVGARSCGRISCSWSAGIFLCNQNDHPIDISCITIAAYAMDIIKYCPNENNKCHGELADNDHFNVVIRDSSC